MLLVDLQLIINTLCMLMGVAYMYMSLCMIISHSIILFSFSDVLHYCYKKILYKFNHTHNFAPPIIDPLEEMYRKVMVRRIHVLLHLGVVK